LSAGHVLCDRATVAIFNIEVDFVTFSKSLEAWHGDGSEMNEYVWTIFLFDEAVSSFLIEPFDDSFGHLTEEKILKPKPTLVKAGPFKCLNLPYKLKIKYIQAKNFNLSASIFSDCA